jgi:two-component system sensor kinase FixL
VNSILSGQKISHFETERLGKDGKLVFVMLSMSPIKDARGRIVGISKILRDLTEGRERERRIAQLQTELVHVSRINDLGQMISVLAHEVNQPLTAVSAYLNGIRRLLATVDHPAISEAIELVAQQNNRAWQILERIRDRVNKRDMKTQVENLAETIAEASQLAFIAGSSPTLEIRCGIDATDAMIDKIQVQQVLTNLIRNAAEAMLGAPAPALLISTARVGDMIEISVADSGPGLPDAVRFRLFQPFVTTKSTGMGVGLSVCFAIIAAHGGNFRFEDGHRGGAIFHFTVPYSKPLSIHTTAALAI